MKKAVVGGSLVLDVTLGVEQEAIRPLDELFCQGKTTYLSDVSIYLGGCVGNTGIAMHKLGMPVKLCSRLSDDPVGRIAESMLASYGLEGGIHLVNGMATSCGIAMTPMGMDKISFFRKGASQTFTPEDITDELLAETDLFHFGYPSSMQNMYADHGAELLRMMKKAKAAGVTTSLDMSMPDLRSAAAAVDWSDILKNILPYVDIFAPSIEETLFMMKRDKYLELVNKAGVRDIIDHMNLSIVPETTDQLIRMGAKIVLLKIGSRGMFLRTAHREVFKEFGRAVPANMGSWVDRELWMPARKVERILSTTGAGDIAIAGFLSSLLNDETPDMALGMAALSASMCISGLDTVSDLKSFSEMKRILNDDYESIPTGLTEEWTFDPDTGCYSRKRNNMMKKEG